MPRLLRLPSRDVVPDGARREFLEEIFFYYREAGRPTLDEISDQITAGEFAGTTSRETVRRTLSGSVPSRWSTAEAIFLVLCSAAGRDPEEYRWPADWN